MTGHPVPTIPGFQAGYVDVAGWSTWHEVGGEGPAAVLLHGGFSGAAAWSAQAPALAGTWWPVAPATWSAGATARSWRCWWRSGGRIWSAAFQPGG